MIRLPQSTRLEPPQRTAPRRKQHPLLGYLQLAWLWLARPLTLVLLAVLLLIGWLAFALFSGARPSRQELAAIRCAHELKSLTERYVTDYSTSAAAFADITAAYPDTALPVNPYSGQACAELNPGDELKPGDFSYLLLLWHDRIEASAVLVYSAEPQSSQCFYNRWFHKRKQRIRAQPGHRQCRSGVDRRGDADALRISIARA